MAFRWPLDNFTISQGFGGNAGYYKQYGQQGHNGVDMAAPYGTPVYAADEGTVAFEGWGQNHSWMGTPAGICVLINHVGSYAGYAHMNQTTVSKGQKVTKGQLIGYVGATGAATGPHLHFDMLPLSPNFNNGYAGRINVLPYIETTNNATEAQIKQAYLDILERSADAAGIAHYKSYTIDFVRQDLANSSEKKALEAKKAAAAQAAADAAKKAAAAAEEANRKAEEAKKLAEAKAAQEAADAAQAELDRIAAEEAAAKAEAEAKAQAQADIAKEKNTLLKQILAIVQAILAKITSVFK